MVILGKTMVLYECDDNHPEAAATLFLLLYATAAARLGNNNSPDNEMNRMRDLFYGQR